jgi:hypothetical protein
MCWSWNTWLIWTISTNGYRYWGFDMQDWDRWRVLVCCTFTFLQLKFIFLLLLSLNFSVLLDHHQVIYKYSKLYYDRQSGSMSWCQATIRVRDQFFSPLEIFLWQLRVCYFMAPSLTRGRVCNLLLLLVLTSAVPLRSDFQRSRDHILLSQILRIPQPGGPGPRTYIPQGQGGPVLARVEAV